MSIKGRWLNGILSFFESTTHETVLPVAPAVFYDDFLGSALDGSINWTAYDTGAATETLKANVASGVCELYLTNADETQIAGLYFGDQRPFVLNQGVQFEAKVRFTVLPTENTKATACIGLCGATNAAVDTVATSIWFRLDGDTGGLITCDSDDVSAHEKSKVTTGITLVASEWVILRIDCTDTASCRFYVNGGQVCSATTFDMSTTPAVALQPVIRMDKGHDVLDLGTMEVDYVRVWQKRS